MRAIKEKLPRSYTTLSLPEYGHISFYCTLFALLHFTDTVVFFYKLKVCGNPASSKSISAIFPTAFAHFMSLSHYGSNISNFFIITIAFIMVICDL